MIRPRRDPRVCVCEVPDCHPNASVDSHARRDRVVVVLSLRLQTCGRVRQCHEADVYLRPHDVDAESSERLHRRNLPGLVRHGPDFEMRLERHAVDLDTSALQFGDESYSGSGFGFGALDAVLVIVELDIIATGERHCFRREPEGEEEILAPDCIVPDVGDEGAVGGERFVHDVPRIAGCAEVLDDTGDVVLHDGGKGSVRPLRLR